MALSRNESSEEVSTYPIELTSIHIFGYCFFIQLWQIQFEGAIDKGRVPFYSIVQSKFKFIGAHF
jgi:hypothetical protein